MACTLSSVTSVKLAAAGASFIFSQHWQSGDGKLTNDVKLIKIRNFGTFLVEAFSQFLVGRKFKFNRIEQKHISKMVFNDVDYLLFRR